MPPGEGGGEVGRALDPGLAPSDGVMGGSGPGTVNPISHLPKIPATHSQLSEQPPQLLPGGLTIEN